jgi:hypothetical protein
VPVINETKRDFCQIAKVRDNKNHASSMCRLKTKLLSYETDMVNGTGEKCKTEEKLSREFCRALCAVRRVVNTV